MKSMMELKDMTYWDITTNESSLTLLILGIEMILLSVMYLFIAIYGKIKFTFWNIK